MGRPSRAIGKAEFMGSKLKAPRTADDAEVAEDGETFGHKGIIEAVRINEDTRLPEYVGKWETDAEGNFKFEVFPGRYTITTEYISFESNVNEGVILRETTDLGTIALGISVDALDEVELVAERTEVEIRLDKRVYNVGRDITVRGGSVSDVMDNIPSVSVDVEGNISLRGNDNVRILINGKPSGLVGLSGPDALRQLPAESIEKLLPTVKKNCTTKFDESVDLSFQINNKQKKTEVNIRTVVNLPGGTGKKVKVAVVCEDAKASDAKAAGAEIVGGDDFIEKIKAGEINFEKLICTPGMMIKLSKLGKVLGPKGLMPNPKLGTVTENLKTAISDAKSGQAEIRNDKDGNIGVSIGKKSFSDEKLIKNFNAVIDTLEKEKSNNTVKGDLIRTAFVTSTMGVSYKLKLGKNI